MAVLAYIGLGSNQGDRQSNLRRALELMDGLPWTRVLRVSSIYSAEPVGKTDQPEFLNMVAELETSLEPGELMRKLQEIEDRLGRRRQERWGPRTIDLDILYIGDLITKGPDLEIPHPRARQRHFVLRPLTEIAPDLVDPVSRKTAAEMLEGMDGIGQMVARVGKLPCFALKRRQSEQSIKT